MGRNAILRRLSRALGLEPAESAAGAGRPRVVLHEYASYEDYRDTQVGFNKEKLGNVWADEATLARVAERIRREMPAEAGAAVFGLCHGSRNGFEQAFLHEALGATSAVVGTDISDTAAQFPSSVQWDFHDRRAEWEGRCDFVYSNSLDQSWKPDAAVRRWLSQLRPGGLLFIEHTRQHGPEHASRMDPFGADPEVMPYLLARWLGMAVAMEVIEGSKPNKKDTDVWLFVLKRLD